MTAYPYARTGEAIGKTRDERAVESQQSYASDLLRDECLALFDRFERRHGLAKGEGQRLQLAGYRA